MLNRDTLSYFLFKNPIYSTFAVETDICYFSETLCVCVLWVYVFVAIVFATD